MPIRAFKNHDNAYDERMREMFINYAHRGASAYYPQNTMSAFYAGVVMDANGIETDVHKTKDGVLVLFHDDTLDKVTDHTGRICDHTYEELLAVNVYNDDKTKSDKIPTLEDFLRTFSSEDLRFAIELKQDGIEKETVDMIEKYGAGEKVIITSFCFDYLRRVKEYAPQYKIGYLYKGDDKALEKVLSVSGEQICPFAANVTPELIKQARKSGLSVRAWGVSSEEIMRSLYDLGVDGMTVNFPDKLTEYIKSKK